MLTPIPPTSTPPSQLVLQRTLISLPSRAANGTGTINGTALTAINGTYAAVVQAIADLDNDPANFNSTLTGGAANATDITALETANGTGTITGAALTAINGTAAAVLQALTDLDADPTNFNSTSPLALQMLPYRCHRDRQWHGTINGSALTAINGTAAAVVQALTDLDTDPTNFNSTLTAGAAAADIAAIEAANGNGTITGSALTEINGTYAEIVQASLTWTPIPPTSTPHSQLVLKTPLTSQPSRPPTATAPSLVRP